MISVLIVDDEKHAREKLRMFISREEDFLIIGEAGDGNTALETINELRPDVVFLDIRMPFPDGIEVILQLSAHFPFIVFTTAYDEYAIKAFELEALDYILKPFDSKRFNLTLERIRKAIKSGGNRNAVSSGRAAEAISATRIAANKSFPVKCGEKYIIQPLNEVFAFEAEGNYIKVHTAAGVHLIRQTLATLQSSLNTEEFIRTHRSYIVNLSLVKELHPLFNGEFTIVMKNGTKFPCSRSYNTDLKKHFAL